MLDSLRSARVGGRDAVALLFSVVVRWWFGGGSVVVRWWFGGGSVVVRWWFGGGSVVVRWWF